MKLYFSPGACSIVPHTCLHQVKERTGQAFDAQLVNLKEGAQKTPEYAAINPRAQVPVLVHNGQTLTQVVAICSYLDAMAPTANLFSKNPMSRAQQLSGLSWMNNTVHPTFTRIFRPEKFIEGDAEKQALRTFNTQVFKDLLKEIDGIAAKGTPFLYGDSFSPADVYALAFSRWGGNIGIDPEQFPSYWKFVQMMGEYSPMKAALAAEGIPLVTYKKP